jgi:nucleoid-associated protein YgaU
LPTPADCRFIAGMRSRRVAPLAILALPLLTLAAGCHYIHFGRPERFKTDAKLLAENSDLRTQRKMLQEELAIARREGEVLRAAIDRPVAPNAAADELAAKLKATTRELGELRASYARLQAERERLPATPAPDTSAGRVAAAEQLAELRGRLGETEDRLADALRNFTQLQAENQQLRSSVAQTKADNVALAQKLDQMTAQNTEARSALAQLNTEFLAQKEARAQAEQAAEALRTQLHAMAAAARTETTPSLASARESAAAGAREIEATLQTAAVTPASPPNAMLSVSPGKLRATAESSAPVASAPAPAPAARTYVVQEGDTLEKISQKVYGRPDQWNLLLGANTELLSNGRPLAPGTELQVPTPPPAAAAQR